MSAPICSLCDEPILDSDPDGEFSMNGDKHAHRGCLVRMSAGSVAHQSKQCSCFGGVDPDRAEGVSRRQDALAAWRFFVEHTSVTAGEPSDGNSPR